MVCFESSLYEPGSVHYVLRHLHLYYYSQREPSLVQILTFDVQDGMLNLQNSGANHKIFQSLSLKIGYHWFSYQTLSIYHYTLLVKIDLLFTVLWD